MDSSEAKFVCSLCNGPIYVGEPVVYDGATGAMAHRFSTWCAHFKAQEAKFLKEVGIEDPVSDPDA